MNFYTKQEYKIGAWLYFCGKENKTKYTNWFKIVQIEPRFVSNMMPMVPEGWYDYVGIEHGGNIFWYPEFIIDTKNVAIKYIESDRDKLFYELADKGFVGDHE